MAEVVLREDSIRRLFAGRSVTIRLGDIDLDLKFDPLARIPGAGSLEDAINEVLRMPNVRARN
jgi:hypothetical protein